MIEMLLLYSMHIMIAKDEDKLVLRNAYFNPIYRSPLLFLSTSSSSQVLAAVEAT
jgi:hypothetical protein